MTYPEAIQRLRNHANLDDHLASGESLAGLLSQVRSDQPFPDIRPLVEDIIRCMDVVNREVNGSDPEITTEYQNSGALIEAAYPVAGILVELAAWQLPGRRDRVPSTE